GGPDKGALSYMFARIGLLFEPSVALSLYVSADTLHDRSRQGFNVPQNSSASHPRPQTQDQLQPLICSLFGRCTPEKRYSYSANYTPRNNSDSSGVSANISYDAGPLTLTSITGYRAIRDTSNSDLDGTDIPLVQVENRRLTFDEVSSELRLSSNPGGGLDFNETLDWILGGYYFHQKFHLVQPVALPALGLPIGPDNPAGERRQTTDSIAVFANANLNLSDRLTLFGGMRYQRDEKQGQGVSPAFSQRTFTNSDVVFEGGVRYSLSSQVNSYFRFAQATRTGGFTAFGTTFDPEKVDSYEIGVKLQSHDRRFSLNTAAFYYDYRNLQRDVTVAIPVAPFFQETVLNAANSRIWGIEAEMSARPVDTITISGFVGYLNTKYKDYFDTDPDTGEIADNSALRMPYAPRLTAGGSLNVDFTPVPLQSLFDRGTILIDGNYMSAQTTTTTDSPIADQKAYAVFNASIKMSAPDDRFYAQLFVDNVFDQFYLTNGENVTNLALFRVEGRPRSAGIRFGFKL
ncbi:MAG: TonB-dependent receptor, partial [Sphingobium sp.]